MKTDREKNIELFLNQIQTQKEWESKINIKLKKELEKYTNEFEDYNYIKNVSKLKCGGYIRYFNLDYEFRWGGILITINKSNDFNILTLKNINGDIFKISLEKNFIFYKKHMTQSDKMKKIFLSYLDK